MSISKIRLNPSFTPSLCTHLLGRRPAVKPQDDDVCIDYAFTQREELRATNNYSCVYKIGQGTPQVFRIFPSIFSSGSSLLFALLSALSALSSFFALSQNKE